MNLEKSSRTSSICSNTNSKFEFPHYAKEVLQWANNARSNPKYCDARVQAKNKELIPCHRFVLVGASSYFKNILDSPGGNGICIPTDIDASIMKLFIDFLYTGSIQILSTNAKEIYLAAKLLGITYIQTGALKAMLSLIDVANCLQLFTLALQVKCNELENKTFNFIIKNFLELFCSEEFFKLPEEALIKLLGCDEIRKEIDEMTIFNTVKTWHDKRTGGGKRNSQTCDLVLPVVQTIRFHLLDSSFLKNCCFSFPGLKSSSKVMKIIDEAKFLKPKPYQMQEKPDIPGNSAKTIKKSRVETAILNLTEKKKQNESNKTGFKNVLHEHVSQDMSMAMPTSEMKQNDCEAMRMFRCNENSMSTQKGMIPDINTLFTPPSMNKSANCSPRKNNSLPYIICCKKVFAVRAQYQQHLRFYHDDDPSLLKCPVPTCRFVFLHQKELLQHRKNHKGQQYLFFRKSPSELKPEDKQTYIFQCNFCDDVFPQRNNSAERDYYLMQHLEQVHSNEMME